MELLHLAMEVPQHRHVMPATTNAYVEQLGLKLLDVQPLKYVLRGFACAELQFPVKQMLRPLPVMLLTINVCVELQQLVIQTQLLPLVMRLIINVYAEW